MNVRNYGWLCLGVLATIALLILCSLATKDESRGVAPAFATLEVTFPTCVKQDVLGIARSEGVRALDPDTKRPVEPAPLAPVEQPTSVLEPVATILMHALREPLDLDALAAFGNDQPSQLGCKGSLSWFIFRPRDSLSIAELQSIEKRLEVALAGDEVLAGTTTRLGVQPMEGFDGEEMNGWRLCVFFEPVLAAARSKGKPPAILEAAPFARLVRRTEGVDGHFENKAHFVTRSRTRARTEFRIAKMFCRCSAVSRVVALLDDMESNEHVTVAEVRYEREGHTLSRPVNPLDEGTARVKFTVRRPWLSSEELRSDIKRTVAAMKSPSTSTEERVLLECSHDEVDSLVRLLSAKGISIRQAGRVLLPSSPVTVELGPSVATLLRSLSETFAKDEINISSATTDTAKMSMSLSFALPSGDPNAKGRDVHRKAAKQRLRSAWKRVTNDLFLKSRVGEGDIRYVGAWPPDTKGPIQAHARFTSQLVSSEEATRQGPRGAPLESDPLDRYRALAKSRSVPFGGHPYDCPRRAR